MSTKIKVYIDPNQLSKTVNANWDRIKASMTEIMLADINKFTRQDTGALISSSYTASVPSQGLLVWDTPYARRVYYTGTPSKDVNPLASLRWAEVAENYYMDQWAKQATVLLSR